MSSGRSRAGAAIRMRPTLASALFLVNLLGIPVGNLNAVPLCVSRDLVGRGLLKVDLKVGDVELF